jgi:hypothetical protein
MINILYLLLSLLGVSIPISIVVEVCRTEHYTYFRHRVIDILITSLKIFSYLLLFIFYIWVKYLFKVMA